jgi:putative OPT family oligopeptide transporter
VLHKEQPEEINLEAHKPFVAATVKMKELTVLPVLLGVVLGIIFGASSLYLALKVGVTVSASIPVAVLSITLFRVISKLFRRPGATILQNNIVQTTGSAGESIAFGVAVTMPALLILGYNMEIGRIMLVSVLGGLLGVLMMIPLRRTLIVKEHGKLMYPEGTACAEVLIVGEKGGTTAKTVFTGFGVGLLYKILNVGFKMWNDVPTAALSWYKGGHFSTEVSPELMGVGYIIGTRVSMLMTAGGLLSALVLTPAIVLFGGGLHEPLYPATKLISDMSIHEIWSSYVLYIGAGAVATGGIISLFQSLPTIVKSLMSGLKGIQDNRSKKANGAVTEVVERTDRDLSLKLVVGGSILLVLAIWAAPVLKMNLLGAVLIVVFGFLFVTVSSRITGEIGSSSNPLSGMTVATLLLTCLIFVMIGWVGIDYRVTALSIAAIVCVAASNGGTTSQDLKTGYLVGATPSAQQIALLIGAFTSAIVIGYTLLLLNDASTIYAKRNFADLTFDTSSLKKEHVGGPEGEKDGKEYFALHLTEPKGQAIAGKYLVDETGHIAYFVDPGINGVLKTRDNGVAVQKYEAPKARLMSLIIDGILTQKLPWSLVLLGVFIALALELSGISSLPFAVGVYLPLSSTTPIMFGGIVRWLVDRKKKSKRPEEDESSPGVLLSSGLIAGGSISGIAIAILSIKENWGAAIDFSKWSSLANEDWFSYVPFVLMMLFTFAVGRGYLLKAKD